MMNEDQSWTKLSLERCMLKQDHKSEDSGGVSLIKRKKEKGWSGFLPFRTL